MFFKTNFKKSTINQVIIYIAICLCLIIGDQVSKLMALKTSYTGPLFRLTLNPDTLMGLVPGNFQMYNIFISICLIAAITFYLIKQFRVLNNLEKLSWIMVISGGISNCIDRVFRGFVIDYIDIRFCTFNLADSLIVIGIGYIVFCNLFQNKNDNKIIN